MECSKVEKLLLEILQSRCLWSSVGSPYRDIPPLTRSSNASVTAASIASETSSATSSHTSAFSAATVAKAAPEALLGRPDDHPRLPPTKPLPRRPSVGTGGGTDAEDEATC